MGIEVTSLSTNKQHSLSLEVRAHRPKNEFPEALIIFDYLRERVLFIGTQFSILYTSMYSPAEAATPRA